MVNKHSAFEVGLEYNAHDVRECNDKC